MHFKRPRYVASPLRWLMFYLNLYHFIKVGGNKEILQIFSVTLRIGIIMEC